MKLTFEEYCQELDYVASISTDYYKTNSLVKETGPESWKDYYENNYTPTEAWIEMLSYGDS